MLGFGGATMLLIAVFSSAFGFACILRFATGVIGEKIAERKLRRKNSGEESEKTDEKECSDPKIYYIRNAKTKSAVKRKPRKKVDLAFKDIKGIVIQPEEFRKRKY